ncbi:MAG TPA: hypothetical protein PLG67_12090 [Bacillota bacterium]|nr:hypothetical protein [Bacillota bacterium]HRS20970.1 hypothetical protein [Clostridia bacterium]HRU42472.1 hypothetical protein [Candidatus Diapherotrites archaeon]HQE66935.1 hypothetical protein [Bacillota bacterium]HQI16625.1 hypothetical protein [Bacillota bacterium]
MGYVKMPEMLSPELAKALAGNVKAVKDESSHTDEMAAALKEFFKEEKNERKKESGGCAPKHKVKDDVECCCPKKVKFIFALNNAVVINVNAACEEEELQPE